MITPSASSLENTRRALYFSQRAIGDYQALQRGPAILGKRVLRRYLTRAIFRALGL